MRIGLSTPVYDAVYSLGQWCATSLVLKKLGLRSDSGPFDWLLGQDVGISAYVELICSGFDGFMAEGSLQRIGINASEHHVHYRCGRTGFSFLHDFMIGRAFADEYPEVRAKYARRISRMMTALSGPSRILFVHFRGEGHYQSELLVSALDSLRLRFPSAAIDLLVLECDKELRPLKMERLTAGLMRVVGDFYDRTRFDAVTGNERELIRVLGSIRLRGRWRNRLRVLKDSYCRRIRRLLRCRT